MRGRDLGIAFGVIGAFALWPSFIWLFAQFGWLSDRWFETGGAIQYTFPIALALSAVVLAVHGMLLNSELAAELEARFETDPELDAEALADARVPAAVGATATATAPAAAASAAPAVEMPAGPEGDQEEAAEEKPQLGGKMAVAPRPKGFKGEKQEKSKKGKVRKVGKQVGRRAGYRAKGAISRGIRNRLGLRL